MTDNQLTQPSLDERPTPLRRTPFAIVAALVLCALFLDACGSSNPGATGTTGANNASASVAKAEQFSQCMRTNGISAFPDPDSSGQLTIDGIVNGSSLNPNTPTFQQALAACKELEPPGFMGTTRTPAQQTAALAFAQCMRENGVASFPDPSPTGPIINVNGAHSIPGFQAAEQKCSAIYAGRLGLPSQ